MKAVVVVPHRDAMPLVAGVRVEIPVVEDRDDRKKKVENRKTK